MIIISKTKNCLHFRTLIFDTLRIIWMLNLLQSRLRRKSQFFCVQQLATCKALKYAVKWNPLSIFLIEDCNDFHCKVKFKIQWYYEFFRHFLQNWLKVLKVKITFSLYSAMVPAVSGPGPAAESDSEWCRVGGAVGGPAGSTDSQLMVLERRRGTSLDRW